MTTLGTAISAVTALAAAGSIILLPKSVATAGGPSGSRGIVVHLCSERTLRLADSAFLARLHVSMTKMMAGMDAPAVGDVDADFVTAMVPHHQGAIDMAEAELVSGTNPQLRRIAQEIIVDQQQEIAAMRLALGETLPPSKPAPDQTPQGGGL